MNRQNSKYCIIIFIVFIWLFNGYIEAGNVRKNELDSVAIFFRQNFKDFQETIVIKSSKQINLNDTNQFYLVQFIDNKGWVLLNTDDVLTPIIAYSDKGEFVIHDYIPHYIRDILLAFEEINFQTKKNKPIINSDWQRIRNIIKERASSNHRLESNLRDVNYIDSMILLEDPFRGCVHWGQSCNEDYPNSLEELSYNKYCPIWDNNIHDSICGHTYAGCTAVAMAQIMWYWQWPHCALSREGINANGVLNGAELLHYYDWNNMPEHLTNSTSLSAADNVSTLIRDCGFAAHMKYSYSGSSASLPNAKLAFENVFGYSVSSYTQSPTSTMLVNEINNLRPVLYAGYNSQGENGHAFVIDGYHIKHILKPIMFHINFGWNGVHNGFWAISQLIDENFECNFTYDNEALIGIQPDPNCSSATFNNINIESNTNFKYTTEEQIIFNGLTTQSQSNTIVVSGTMVDLKPNTHIYQGSNLRITIKNVPCQSRTEQKSFSESKDSVNNIQGDTTHCILIYPNPSSMTASLETTKDIERILIINLFGHIVLQYNSISTIDITSLPQGTYAVNVFYKDGTMDKRCIIKQ